MMEHKMANSNRMIRPRQGILSIPLYIGGKSKSKLMANPMKLSANENPYGPSDKAVEVFMQCQKNLGVYPDGNHTALRNAIADTMRIDEKRIICGAGSDELINFVCQCYATRGDEVIHTEHGFAMYRISSLVVGATPVPVPEINRHADIDGIIRACNDHTKIIFLANPNNPTGTLIKSADLNKLIDRIPEHILLVLDEAYAEYIENFESGLKLVDTKSNVFVTRTFSKIYGLGSLRVGWGYGPGHVIEALQRVKGPFNISSVGQEVATAAIKDQEYVEKCRQENLDLKLHLADALHKINIPSDPSFTNFLLLRFSNCRVAKLADEFLQINGILVRNVSNYGLENGLRVSIGTSSDCEKVIKTLTEFQEISHGV